jgi:hypothetical protein
MLLRDAIGAADTCAVEHPWHQSWMMYASDVNCGEMSVSRKFVVLKGGGTGDLSS